MTGSMKKYDAISSRAREVEAELCAYLGHQPNYSSADFITSLDESFIKEVCPEAQGLPAALVVWEEEKTSNVSIHFRDDIFDILNRTTNDRTLLSSNEGLTSFLILIEEISHFHYYVRNAESHTKITRFEMELQAELEKPIIAALIFAKSFGRPHVNQLTNIIFDNSVIHGSMTDYKLASKLAEKFWKNHLQTLGDTIVSDSSFRRLVQTISRRTGQEKQRSLFEESLKFAA